MFHKPAILNHFFSVCFTAPRVPPEHLVLDVLNASAVKMSWEFGNVSVAGWIVNAFWSNGRSLSEKLLHFQRTHVLSGLDVFANVSVEIFPFSQTGLVGPRVKGHVSGEGEDFVSA